MKLKTHVHVVWTQLVLQYLLCFSGIEENIGTVDVDVEHPHDVSDDRMETEHTSGSYDIRMHIFERFINPKKFQAL